MLRYIQTENCGRTYRVNYSSYRTEIMTKRNNIGLGLKLNCTILITFWYKLKGVRVKCVM